MIQGAVPSGVASLLASLAKLGIWGNQPRAAQKQAYCNFSANSFNLVSTIPTEGGVIQGVVPSGVASLLGKLAYARQNYYYREARQANTCTLDAFASFFFIQSEFL
jgi:hypothetical protein